MTTISEDVRSCYLDIFIISRTEDVLKETNNELNINMLGFKKRL